MTSWNDTLNKRAEGDVDGFIGHDENLNAPEPQPERPSDPAPTPSPEPDTSQPAVDADLQTHDNH